MTEKTELNPEAEATAEETTPIDYTKLAEEIPANWVETEELNNIAGVIFENLKSSMNIPPEEVAEMLECEPDDILATVRQGAVIYARMMLFEEKYAEMIELFPKDDNGVINYPDKVLARVFAVTPEEAIQIFEEHFSIGDVNQVNSTTLAEIRESIEKLTRPE